MIIFYDSVESINFWTIISSCAAVISAFAACGAAFLSQKSIDTQSKINLYELRYNKIYKLILETIEKEKNLFLVKYNTNKQNEITSHFCSEFDFARFLISEEDFKNIINIHNEIWKIFADFFQKYSSIQGKTRFITEEEQNLARRMTEDISKLTNDVEIKKQDILKIIVPYLQIV